MADVEKELTSVYDSLQEMYDYLKANPTEGLLFSITEGSFGGTDTRLSNKKIKPSEVTDIKDNIESIQFHLEKNKAANLTIDTYPSPILWESNEVSPERIEMLVNLFMNNVTNEEGESLSAKRKVQVLADLFRSNAIDKAKTTNPDLYTVHINGGG